MAIALGEACHCVRFMLRGVARASPRLLGRAELQQFRQWQSEVSGVRTEDVRAFSSAHLAEALSMLEEVQKSDGLAAHLTQMNTLYRKAGHGACPDTFTPYLVRALADRNYELGNAVWKEVIEQWRLSGPRSKFVLAMCSLLMRFAADGAVSSDAGKAKELLGSTLHGVAADRLVAPSSPSSDPPAGDQQSDTESSASADSSSSSPAPAERAGQLVCALLHKMISDGSIRRAHRGQLSVVLSQVGSTHARQSDAAWFETVQLFFALTDANERVDNVSAQRAVPAVALSWVAALAAPRTVSEGDPIATARKLGASSGDSVQEAAVKRLLRRVAMLQPSAVRRAPNALLWSHPEASKVLEQCGHDIVKRKLALQVWRSEPLYMWAQWLARELRPLRFDPTTTVTPSNLWPENPSFTPEGEEQHREFATQGPLFAPFLASRKDEFGTPHTPLRLHEPVDQWHRTKPDMVSPFDPERFHVNQDVRRSIEMRDDAVLATRENALRSVRGGGMVRPFRSPRGREGRDPFQDVRGGGRGRSGGGRGGGRGGGGRGRGRR